MIWNLPIALALLGSILVGYLLGGINWAIILTRLYQRRDIRDQGSGNAGMTNVLRSVGKLPALLTFVGDFLKNVAAVLLGQLFMYWALHHWTTLSSSVYVGSELLGVAKYLAGAACVVGHIFPIYYGFRGGKGIVAAAAMIALTDWRVFLAVVVTFGALFLWKKIISLASITAAALYPAYAFLLTFFVDYLRHGHSLGYVLFVTCVAVFISGLVLFVHRANIGRLMRGEEKPIIKSRKS